MASDTAPDLELLQFIHSHFNEKARWALDHKGLPHRRTSLLPGPHMPEVRKRTGQTMTPVLRIGDSYIAGSAEIIARVDSAWPENPLLPADPALREAAAAIQQDMDSTLGPAIRHCVFAIARNHPAFVADLMGGHLPWLKRKAYAAAVPMILKRISAMMRLAEPDRLAEQESRIDGAMDRIAAQAGPSGYLAGETFSAADLAAAALLSPIARPAECQSRIVARPPDEIAAWMARRQDHPAAQWAREMFRRHRGRSMEIA
ncbi:MAG: glutathione S-transferase [Rhodospirillales bacterium]